MATRPSGPTEPIGSDPEESRWEAIRAQFKLVPDLIHMSALLISSHPAPVRDAIARYRRELNHRPANFLERENRQRQRAAREAAAEYLGADWDGIALTDSTTMGLALIYSGLDLSEGHEILTTEHDYYVTHESLRLSALRTRATISRVSLYDNVATASKDEIVERFKNALKPSTRAVALTWVHSGTGIKLPISALSLAVSEANRNRDERDRILLCVDGVHGFGVEADTASDLGCDFFISGCHKWLFGPRGTGIIWGRKEAWARVKPTIPSFIDSESWSAWIRGDAPEGPNSAARMTPGGFKTFEHQWALPETFAFHQKIGKSQIAGRTHDLSMHLKEGLANLDSVNLITPMDKELSAGIVCFAMDGHSPNSIVGFLEKRKIVATTTPYAIPYARLTPSIQNSHQEVEKVIEALRATS